MPTGSSSKRSACRLACARRATRCGPAEPLALFASRERLDSRARELKLIGRTHDLVPGRFVHRDAVAATPLAHFALGLARDAHSIEARSGPALSQPVEEQTSLALERRRRTELPGVKHDGEHAVQYALLARLLVMPRPAAGKRATEQLGRDRHAVALVLTESEHRAERRHHRIAGIGGRIAFRVDQASRRHFLALVVRHAELALRD